MATTSNNEADAPISKFDIECLVDAAEKIYIQEIYYISYMLFEEAQKTLQKLKFKFFQTLFIGPAENIEDLESRICNGLSLLTVLGTLKPPSRYARKTTIGKLVLFYSEYKQMFPIDGLREEEKKHKKWGILSANFQESEGRTTLRETTLTTAKSLRTALKALSLTSQERIPKQFLQDTKYGEEGSSETYNVIACDSHVDRLPDEVNDAIASLQLGIEDFSPLTRGRDVLDCLQLSFKFQESSVSNQRENIVNLLSNELMRLGTPGEQAIDKALDSVFKKSLGNYIEWCNYLRIKPIWKNTNVLVNATGKDENATSKEKKILYICLYYLIWGEAANVRFLPECLCYIFHRMSEELDRKDVISDPFIKRVIEPLYKVIAAEAQINNKRDAPHSKWRNYDDFNEYFWSKDCFQLGWPLNGSNSPFFQKPPKGSTTVFGKTSFLERRTFLHLYHSFHRMWIFHVMMFEVLVIFAFNDEKLNFKTLRETLTVTYFLMKLFQSILDIVLQCGAYSKTIRILFRFIWFMSATLIICFPRMKCLKEKTSSIEESLGFENYMTLLGIYAVNFRKCFQEKTSLIEELIGFKNYIIVLGVYALFKISFSISYQFLPKKSENSYVAHVIKWINQDLYLIKEEYVGRGMNNDLTDIFWYMIFWIVTLGINFAFTYYYLIRPLVPTREITDVSKNIHNMLAIGSLWAGVICAYIVGSHVAYNVTSAVVGYIVGRWWDHVGNIKSLGDVRKCFDDIPKFMDHLNIRESRTENNQEDVNSRESRPENNQENVGESRLENNQEDINNRESRPENNQEDVKRLDAAEFSRFWNQIVMNLREEDYISDLEQYALSMPKKCGCIDVIQWPPFLLVGKVSLAIKIAAKSDHQKDMWDEIKSDVYMKYAVEECFQSVKFILSSVMEGEGSDWVEEIYGRIRQSLEDGNLDSTFQLNNLESIIKEISELTETLDQDRRRFEAGRELRNKAKNAQRLKNGATNAATNLYNVIRRDFLREEETERREFSDFKGPTEDPELRSQIRRLHMLLNVKSADHVPRNREARRRLEFFTNSLFMSMPKTKPVREMLSFSVLTPYYDEAVLYTIPEILKSNDDGVTLLDYLKNLYPDEWNNYCERLKKRYIDNPKEEDFELRERLKKRYIDNPEEEDLELRLWASYRGQTLARTVRGTMHYQKALLLQASREGSGVEDLPRTSRVYGTRTSDLDVSMDEGEYGLSSTSSVDVTSLSGLDESIDEDTRATLEKLVKRNSRGKSVKKTFDIRLRDKENYNQWMNQMELHLETKEMKGFVDGSLRDPDPKGESQEGQMWKQLDEQVMEWIIDSLDESLHDSVKYFMTAEQMWDELEEIIEYQSLNERFDKVKAHVDLKFTYVVTCQMYGKQKREGKDVAADIAFLLKRNEGLRVAFVDQVNDEFYSKLVKADKNGNETEIYCIKLPGDPILGEGKPENQNHAIVFTRGNAIQTIDMNQDNYFEETLKMRNLLEEFRREHPPTILGIREHIFTGSASSLASFMSNQETGFVTLGQRVIANPLKVRMHYGHPDVFDRVFHITRGGISKASRGINISEDIYAGFNSTLRQGSVTHHEYIQAGKGRDVGFNQIATFEGKVAGGNGEQVLSRDIYRLGQRLDFFRMLSFYYTTVGYYFSSLLMVITLYIILYGNLIMALSGTRVPHVLNDIDMAPEWFLMIVLLPAIYMLLVPYLEQGLEKAVESFLAMFFSLGSIFFAFSLGTRIHWFGRTIIHGGASYQATGRGFVLHHITFSENYRLYSRSHFVKGMEVLFLVVVYIIYGFHSVRAFYNNLLLLGGSILSISWIVAPFLFDSSPFDLNKNSQDQEDWKNWLNRKSDEVEKSKRIEEKVKESWEIWWKRELDHIRTPAGRIIETILSLRFFIFPLVVGYKLDVQGLKNSLWNCVIPWIFLVGILFAHEVIRRFFSNKKPEIDFFSYNQLATIGALAIAYYYSAFGDMLAFFIAIITTVWGFLSICVACKPTLKRFSLWTPVKYLARICDTGMGALMFKIANMFSQRSIKQYLVRNMFDQNISELLHKSSTELKMQSGVGKEKIATSSTTWVGDPTTRNTTRVGPPFYEARREYIDKLPEMYHTFIDDVQDVDGDGNCGFRAVAVGLGRHQDEWKNIRSDLLQELEKHKKLYVSLFVVEYTIPDLLQELEKNQNQYVPMFDVEYSIRDLLQELEKNQYVPMFDVEYSIRDLLQELEKNQNLYVPMFDVEYAILKNRLTFFKMDEVAPEEKWKQMPEMGVFIATHFKVILHVITNSRNGCLTYLPLCSRPPSWNRLKFMSLGYVNDNHYVHLSLKKGYPVPDDVINLCHKSKWMTPYKKWLKKREHVVKQKRLTTIADVFFL